MKSLFWDLTKADFFLCLHAYSYVLPALAFLTPVRSKRWLLVLTPDPKKMGFIRPILMQYFVCSWWFYNCNLFRNLLIIRSFNKSVRAGLKFFILSFVRNWLLRHHILGNCVGLHTYYSSCGNSEIFLESISKIGCSLEWMCNYHHPAGIRWLIDWQTIHYPLPRVWQATCDKLTVKNLLIPDSITS